MNERAIRDRAATKGERTRGRILDAAEACFATKGFEGASLREIAGEVGIQEPGLYNYFPGKRALYAAVLERALGPIADALERQLEVAEPGALEELPGLMTDLLCEHPQISALFQQALRGDPASVGHGLMHEWLDRLFVQGLETARSAGLPAVDRGELAIGVIAMFNLCTGYFLSQRAFTSMAAGDVSDPANLARQKSLLRRVARAVFDGATPD